MRFLAREGVQKTARIVLAIATLLAAATILTERARANHQPANKVAVAGNSLKTFESSPVAGAPVVTLLKGTMKVSGPTDLIIQVALECSLFTDIVNVANEESSSTARVDAWIEINGVAVPVAGGPNGKGQSGGPADDGKVTFCDRTYRRITTNFSDDEDETEDTIRDFLRTKSTHGFNWMKLDAGRTARLITIELKATITHATEGNADNFAQAVVGKRTMIVQPARLANDAVITNDA